MFCPCGCGANLILVAGDKNLREQHFRMKDGSSDQDCHVVTEGKTSVDSKIVLKCWLDEKLKAADMESRVPIHAVDDIPGTTNSPSCPKAGRRRSAIAMREGICPRKK